MKNYYWINGVLIQVIGYSKKVSTKNNFLVETFYLRRMAIIFCESGVINVEFWPS